MLKTIDIKIQVKTQITALKTDTFTFSKWQLFCFLFFYFHNDPAKKLQTTGECHFVRLPH